MLWVKILVLIGNLSIASEPPYPGSTLFKGITFAPASRIVRLARGSDNWPGTWGEDDRLYTAYGDGWGFEPRTEKKLSLGIARVEGHPPDVKGVNIRTSTGERVGQGSSGGKASGMLMVEGALYMLVRNTGHAQLAWSTDHGKSWTWADWKFTPSFGCPTFLNFGKHYAGARDDYVYVYSPDSDSAYRAGDRMVLCRVRKDKIRLRRAYEFFQRLDPDQKPIWTKDIKQRGGVFHHPGRCYRGGISYHPVFKRYLWCQVLPESRHSQGPRFEGGFGIYEAPEPWGPWRTVFFTRHWDVGPGETCSIPTKWISADGLAAWLLFSGDDCFSLRQMKFVPASNKQ